MDAFLLDTTVLTICLDPTHQFHVEKSRALNALPADAPRYVSVVALAELAFGAELAITIGKGDSPALREKIRKARDHAVLDITHHTADAYAKLKSKMAAKYLAKVLRRDRPKYIEDWVDQATGKILGVDENDLWMCAQAKERGLILVTADGRMKRIGDADPDVSLLLI
ncbi:MAG: PIN domain-containing protein [Rhodospirillales bacterium]|nr:PIN domain-containing protein [Rhodospirillales bacterium]